MSYNFAIVIPPIPADDAEAWEAVDALSQVLDTNTTGTTKTINTLAITDEAKLEAIVFQYARDLTGGKTIDPHPTAPGIWVSALPDGTTINVRNVSSSGAGRWTIDIVGDPRLTAVHGAKRTEIKFK